MSKTKIEWADEVWNPVTGCTKVSAGCKNCYAETIANRFWGDRKFTDVQCHEDRLFQASKWKKPRMIFVNSMSDLFHEDIPKHFLDRIMNQMLVNPRHIFQVLTKRPDRMQKYFANTSFTDEYNIPNLWIGVSVENQETADERIPLLLQTPAKVRWISAEPLLAKIDLMDYFLHEPHPQEKLDWVVVGGESGPKARPMHPDWVRSIRDQCQAANVPFFFKQWGSYVPSYNAGERSSESGYYNKSIGDNWVKHYHQFGDGMGMVKVGKKKAGNLLDGKKYREFPDRVKDYNL